MITPEIVVDANTRARNATAIQNNRSVFHHPAIKSVATTDVAHPLTMLTAQAATAVRPLGSPANRPARPPRRRATGLPWWGGGCRGIWVVADSWIVGIGPVGARRMIRVRDSEGGSGGSDTCAEGGGSLGAVTSSSVVADVDTTLGQPRHGVDSFGAAL